MFSASVENLLEAPGYVIIICFQVQIKEKRPDPEELLITFVP